MEQGGMECYGLQSLFIPLRGIHDAAWMPANVHDCKDAIIQATLEETSLYLKPMGNVNLRHCSRDGAEMCTCNTGTEVYFTKQ